MASKKSEGAAQQPRQAKAKNTTMTQFVLAGAGIVVVIVVALLLFGGGGKKPAATRARAAGADTGSAYARTRKPVAAVARKAKSSRDSMIAKRREEKARRKQEAAASGSRTTRSTSGGYVSGGSSRAVSTPNQLRAILTDNTGSRTALVGERRLKAGDDVDGRKIVEVTGDGMKVEYRQKTYSVRVGEKIY